MSTVEPPKKIKKNKKSTYSNSKRQRRLSINVSDICDAGVIASEWSQMEMQDEKWAGYLCA